MDKYSANRTCPKCGNDLVATEYWDGSKGYPQNVMKRECYRCGHIWYEKPIDKPDPPEEEK